MNNVLADLWPDLKLDALTPLAILRLQAKLLGERTKGILVAEVREEFRGTVRKATLVVQAPRFNGFEAELLRASYSEPLVYPASVIAEETSFEGSDQEYGHPRTDYKQANDDVEFTQLVGEVLKSPRVRALLSSLVARSVEATIPAAG
jgi:transglutaminase-like putative cysteine protease